MKGSLLVLSLAVFVSGCTTSYVGRNDATFWKRACEVGVEVCKYNFRDFEMHYKVTASGKAEYTVQGDIKVAKSLVGTLKTVDRLQVKLAYMDKGEVVLQNSVYTWGDIQERNTFQKTFRSDKPILFSVPVEYAYRMTELSL